MELRIPLFEVNESGRQQTREHEPQRFDTNWIPGSYKRNRRRRIQQFPKEEQGKHETDHFYALFASSPDPHPHR
jgi:hypothetical protein